jgi:hypothetical protein
MTQLDEAVIRYHKILESDPYKDLSWAEELRSRMQAEHLTMAGRPVTPVLRPHFVTKRQYAGLVKAAEPLFSAIGRIERLALASPQLLSRMALLPAEKMLAAVDPGYPFLSVTSLLDTHLNNGTLRFIDYNADTPAGVAYGEGLSNLFYDCGPMKEFRKRYSLSKMGGTKPLLQALLKAFKEFGGNKNPNIAILECRQAFQSSDSAEFRLLADYFRKLGFATEVVSPDQLEYKNGVLRRGDFEINLMYRRMQVHEFLVRFDLTHPLVKAYRDHAVCVVNSFRSEIAQKKAVFDLLTDDAITSGFPAAEKKAIREFIPWTRVVTASRTTYQNQSVDLVEFIRTNREKLVLKPNDEFSDLASFHGAAMDDARWDRAIATALRYPYVVQEHIAPARAVFPVWQYGQVEMREMEVEVHPHTYLGKVQGCSTWLNATGPSGYSTVAGLAPTFLLDSK